jgi:hypothetical protein
MALPFPEDSAALSEAVKEFCARNWPLLAEFVWRRYSEAWRGAIMILWEDLAHDVERVKLTREAPRAIVLDYLLETTTNVASFIADYDPQQSIAYSGGSGEPQRRVMLRLLGGEGPLGRARPGPR